ncbi:alpha/beta hydrolase fold-3 domain-containing protein [Xylariaceae sp. FL0594]|nr:alpha/beta hydrolase fold-3 domain-containing protein [Xylariaceae sp. FL0594]
MRRGNGHPLVSYQPLRLLFQLSYYLTIIARLPYFAVVAFVPAFRPNPNWSAKQTFNDPQLTLDPGKEGDRFQIVKRSNADIYKGPLASDVVKPATIGGTWIPHAPDIGGAGVGSKRVILYFHGGAFIQGDGRDVSCGQISKRLLKFDVGDAVFSVQYRLSGWRGQNPYPAALQDAFSSYLSAQIIICGDSSGGNLATALLRYLAEFGANTPQPKCAVLISPWVAPFQYVTAGNPHRSTDFIPGSYPRWGALTYGGSRPNAEDDPYITSLGNPFATPVPIFAHAGDAEMFFERITRWADEMRGVPGNVVEIYHEKDAVHDTFLTGDVAGFGKSADDVAAKAAEFVRKY